LAKDNENLEDHITSLQKDLQKTKHEKQKLEKVLADAAIALKHALSVSNEP